jgi:hypothetical protein
LSRNSSTALQKKSNRTCRKVAQPNTKC